MQMVKCMRVELKIGSIVFVSSRRRVCRKCSTCNISFICFFASMCDPVKTLVSFYTAQRTAPHSVLTSVGLNASVWCERLNQQTQTFVSLTQQFPVYAFCSLRN